MPTVPNWIPRAVVILSDRRGNDDAAHAVASWRATTTQVVVTLDDRKRTEIRFRLDDLRPVGEKFYGAKLLDGAEPHVITRINMIRYASSLAALEMAIYGNRLDHSRGNPAELAEKITAIRDAAARALADLAPLL